MRVSCVQLFGIISLSITVLAFLVSTGSPFWVVDEDSHYGLLARCHDECYWYFQNDFAVQKNVPGKLSLALDIIYSQRHFFSYRIHSMYLQGRWSHDFCLRYCVTANCDFLLSTFVLFILYRIYFSSIVQEAVSLSRHNLEFIHGNKPFWAIRVNKS